MAEIGNKDKEFWECLREWDVIILVETWTDEKRWNRARESLCVGGTQSNKKNKRKGNGWNDNKSKE